MEFSPRLLFGRLDGGSPCGYPPQPVQGSSHAFKYRLAFVVNGICVLRYDNEVGKGDHKHIGSVEYAYVFTSPRRLLADFWSDVDAWRKDHA